MQRREVRFAAGHSDYSLLVVTLSPPITGAVTELYGLPLLGREGGFLLCIPHGVISPSMFEDVDAAEMAPTWLGVGVALEVPLVEEADDGTPVPLNAAGMVDVIDVTDDLLNFVKQYDPVVDSDIEVVPYHDEHPGCIPDLQALNQPVVAWITERQEASSGFYSAQEDPGSAPKAKQGAKKAAAPKRVTNAVLLEQMTVLSSQVQLLAARRTFSSRGTFPPLPFLQEVSRLARQASCRQCPAPLVQRLALHLQWQKVSLWWVDLRKQRCLRCSFSRLWPLFLQKNPIACGKWRAFTRSHSECPGSTVDSVDL